jgi:predicted O-methyltransferase YrrM
MMQGEGTEAPYPPGHFYSPFPDTRALSKEPYRSRVWPEKPQSTPGIDWRDPDQLELCRQFARQPDLVFPTEPAEGADEYAASNTAFPLLDGLVLQAVLRAIRPRRMIEVGAGYTSLVSARVNHEVLGGTMNLTCIDPYPRPFLVDGVEGVRELRQEEVQDTPLELFDSLEDGDVLFIDTSHTVKTGGDVTWIFHQVIPRLRPGVVIQVHDAFLPGDYPMKWVLEGWGWNETYLLQSFLTFNAAFEIVFGVQYMIQNHQGALLDAFDQLEGSRRLLGASLWFRRSRRA